MYLGCQAVNACGTSRAAPACTALVVRVPLQEERALSHVHGLKEAFPAFDAVMTRACSDEDADRLHWTPRRYGHALRGGRDWTQTRRRSFVSSAVPHPRHRAVPPHVVGAGRPATSHAPCATQRATSRRSLASSLITARRLSATRMRARARFNGRQRDVALWSSRGFGKLSP